MKTNTYLGLIGFQIAASQIQQGQLARQQAARDKELQRITQEAAQAAQNAAYAQWRQTPEGQTFEAWRGSAIETLDEMRARNEAWEAARDAAITATTGPPPLPVNRTLIRVTIAAWILAILLVAISGGAETGAVPVIGGILGTAAIAGTITSIVLHKRHKTAAGNDLKRRRDQIAANYDAGWHSEWDFAHTQAATDRLGRDIEGFMRTFPAPSQLPALGQFTAVRGHGAHPELLKAFAS